MSRPQVIVAVVALVIGALGGFLWWGLPTERLQGELGQTRERAGGLERQLEEARTQARSVAEQLKSAQDRLGQVEGELRTTKEMNARLQRLVSQGTK